MNTGSRRKPFTLREWAMERLVDKTLGYMKPPMEYAKFLDRMSEVSEEMMPEIAKAFGITVDGDKMINQPIAP